MRKFNFKLVNGKELKAELIEDNLVFESLGTYRAKHLIALKHTYTVNVVDFILDHRENVVIPNKTFLAMIEELEDELGYIHTRPTIDIVVDKKKMN